MTWVGTVDKNVTEISLYSSKKNKCNEKCWIFQGKNSHIETISYHCLQCQAIKKSPYLKEIKKALKEHGQKIKDWIK